jgi:2-oxoglutarate/2-oxoacid ferredoxin oxidoreductase subunit alpha
LDQAQKVVCVESNATGQLAQLIRRETGFIIKNRVARYDGLPITPDYILENLR